jgi:hypothetical protein
MMFVLEGSRSHTLSLGPGLEVSSLSHTPGPRAASTTYHFFFCFFAPVFAGAMVNVDVGILEMSWIRGFSQRSPLEMAKLAFLA